MVRLLFITDFTEQFAYRLLEGIIDYSKESGIQWVVCKMPPSFKRKLGMQGVLEWALKWQADVVIGQFDDGDDVGIFRKNGIVALAQDYHHRFSEIPNITSDYIRTGELAAAHFISKGFKNLAFFGYSNVCWSDERCEGFRKKAEESGLCEFFSVYDGQKLDKLWYYDSSSLRDWLLSLPKPVGIMACDDNQGNILLEACNSCGLKIPMDVSVIGVDNDEVLCKMSNPSLSSISTDVSRAGYNAAKIATMMMADRDYPGEDISIDPLHVISRASTSVFATGDPYVLRALMFIHNNIERKINVSDVLDEVPLSRRLLEVRFKKEVGETIYSYISHLRVECFAKMLLETSLSEADIVASLDEDDSKSMSRRFRAVYGCSPREFRKKGRKLQ